MNELNDEEKRPTNGLTLTRARILQFHRDSPEKEITFRSVVSNQVFQGSNDRYRSYHNHKCDKGNEKIRDDMDI